jgi:hypothetical protein
MNQLSVDELTEHHNFSCAELIAMAERELAALFSAVTELFGSEQASLSAEDWLRVLATMNGLPASTHEWRGVTFKVLARLAKRVKPVPPRCL